MTAKGEKSSFKETKGPSTMNETLRTSVIRSGSLMGSHDRWVVEAHMDVKNRSVFEHRVITRAMYFAHAVDGINLKMSIAFEYLNRRRQLIEEAHREDASKPNFEAAKHYMGDEDLTGATYLAPNLRAHVALELGKEAAIQKESRKIRE